MPIYNFSCEHEPCEKRGEVVEKMVKSYETKPPCPVCGTEMTRQFSSVGTGVKLKGGGWYKQGYR